MLHEGQVVKRADGESRIYLPSTDVLTLTCKEGFIDDALNSMTDNAVNGVKGVSPLLFTTL